MFRAQLVDFPGGHFNEEKTIMMLAQLIDAEELKSLSPEELREMILKLDDEVVYGTEPVVAVTN